MKKLFLAFVAVAVVGLCSTSAEAGWRYGRRAVRYAPVVRVAPRYVAPRYVAPVVGPVIGPVVVRRPAYIYDYPYYRAPASVIVGGGGYYYGGGGVRVRVPGFGLDVRY